MFGALVSASVVAISSGFFGDDDRDGLLNGWETVGFGVLDPKIHGCKPDRSDIIICFRIRPGMAEKTMEPTITRLKKFYADMPYKNLNGEMGLNLIPIVLPPHPDDKGQDYKAFYEQGLPLEWRGLAHGVFVGNSPGGGGQANRPDWAGTGYNWFTIAHEVGHQLGLPHNPIGFRLGSPIHTSLMNYDYSYQLDGEPEKVHFSPGTFESLALDESDLDEVLPFPAASLSFLSKRPHYFAIKAIDAKSTSVDWNRNGVHSEKNVRANINDGYSVELSSNIKSTKIFGAPVLVSNGPSLFLVGTKNGKADLTAPTLESPAAVALFSIEKDKCVELPAFEAPLATGDLSAVMKGQVMDLAYSTKTGWARVTLRVSKGSVSVVDVVTHSERVSPTLVATPNGIVTLLRDVGTGAVFVLTADGLASTSVSSTHQVGGVWNSKKKAVAIAYTEDFEKQKGRIRVGLLKGSSVVDSVLVGGEKSPALTSNRPILLFDASQAGGPNGAYKVIVKGGYPDPHQAGLNYMCRQIGTGTGWWIKMLGNEWAFSRSVGSATEHNGDLAYAYRWHGGPEDNMTWISMRASGIEKGVITDVNEVKYIFEQGLRNSLNNVRNEQWPRKGWK